MSRKRTRPKPAGDSELLSGIRKRAGRAVLPPHRVFRDKHLYSRKIKHKKSDRHGYDDGHSFYDVPVQPRL